MTTFKWKVAVLKVAENNLVTRVELVVTGTDGNKTASVAYARDLVRGDTFTPYEQLTEQQVLNWCFSPQTFTWTDQNNVQQSITKHLQVDGETQVTNQIERQSVQKQFEPALPWS
jgi:hypothetical protein